MRQGILAMEDMEEEVRGTPPVEPEMREEELTAEAPETEALAEVEATHDEVIEAEEASEEAADTAETLDGVREQVEEAAETEGGVSEPEARALEIAVEHMLLAIGSKPEKAKVFPAMEGFKEKATRLQATRVALEEMDGKIKKIWAAIIENMKKVFEAVVAFIKSLVNGTKFLEGRANMIKKAAAKKKGAKAAEISTAGWGSKLTIKGEAPSATAVKAGVEHLSANEVINFDYGKAASEANATIVKMMDLVGKEGGAEEAKKLHDELVGHFFAGKGTDGEGFDLPFGNAKVMMHYQKAADGRLTGVDVKLEVGEVKVAEKVEGATAEEAEAIADAVIKNLSKFGAYTKQADDIAAMFKSLASKMAGMVGKVSGKASEADQSASKKVHELAQTVNAVKTMLARTSTVVRHYDMKCCSAALTYAGKSVAAIGKTEKQGETAPAAA
jgi:uncharacterized protein YukE